MSKGALAVVDDALHQIRTRLIRGAPIYFQHVNTAEDRLKDEATRLVAEAEQRGVAWAIKEIDEMHFDSPANLDGTFKGIKNSLRNRFKLRVGVDPAPNYPIDVRLESDKTEVV